MQTASDIVDSIFIHVCLQDHALKGSKFESIDNKFAVTFDAVEEELKSSTVGLVTLEEMRERRENLVREREKQIAAKMAAKDGYKACLVCN